MICFKNKKIYLTLDEKIEMYEKLPDDEKGNFEIYDWGEDLGKEILEFEGICNGDVLI